MSSGTIAEYLLICVSTHCVLYIMNDSLTSSVREQTVTIWVTMLRCTFLYSAWAGLQGSLPALYFVAMLVLLHIYKYLHVKQRFSFNMDFVWWVLLETPRELLLSVYSPPCLCPSKDPVHCRIHVLRHYWRIIFCLLLLGGDGRCCTCYLRHKLNPNPNLELLFIKTGQIRFSSVLVKSLCELVQMGN